MVKGAVCNAVASWQMVLLCQKPAMEVQQLIGEWWWYLVPHNIPHMMLLHRVDNISVKLSLHCLHGQVNWRHTYGYNAVEKGEWQQVGVATLRVGCGKESKVRVNWHITSGARQHATLQDWCKEAENTGGNAVDVV